VFVPIGYFPYFDGVTQSHSLLFEVKFEEQARETFNLCFEYSYKGNPSGIANTQATTWVHVVPLTKERICCYEFNVERLRRILKGFPTYKAGDNKQSDIKLLPLQKAEEIKSDKFFITIDWEKYKPYWD